MSIRLILVDPHYAICEAWRKHFAGLPNVEIVRGVFEDLTDYDCMVSAANAFGLMDGGVDAAITAFFGQQLQERVQAHIREHYLGEQPVGTAFVIATGHAAHPWLAHTPTMRVPANIGATQNAYAAMWAMLLAVHAHNHSGLPPIATVACPGLGTGVGRMLFDEAARQMALAYRLYLHRPERTDWLYATRRQRWVLGETRPGDVLPGQP